MTRGVLMRGTAMLVGLGAFAAGAEARPVGKVVRVAEDRKARQPQAAVDADGRIFVAFGLGDEVRCARSTDGGATFDAKAVGSPGKLALGMRRGPRVAATGKSVVVSAIGGREGGGRDGDLWAWYSADGGETWGEPKRVNAVSASAREGLHGMASGPEGAVFCAWLDFRNDRMEIFGARSADGGATWEPDALVYRSPGVSVCTCCHPSVAFAPDGTLYVLWRNDVKGARDMYLAKSTDGGKSFDAATKLGEGTWTINACPMDGGAVAVGPEGVVETAWRREGVVFADRPGRPERKLGEGVQPWIAAGPGGPTVAWLARRPGPLLVLAPGASEPITLAEVAGDPVVASGLGGRGPVVAVWEADPQVGGIVAAVLAEGRRP